MTRPPARRLFFALWPDASVRGALAARAETARRAASPDAVPDEPGRLPPSGRPIPVDNLHLTLAFLGKVEETRISEVTGAVAALDLPGFELTIDRRGWWKKSSILWLGPSAPPAALNRLVKALWTALEPLGFWSDFRDFRPHVTVARRCMRGGRGEVEPVAWPVREFALMVSDLDHKGATYRVLETWPLNPA